MTRPTAKGARRLTLLALLTAIALTIFMAEAQLPPILPIPGVKLGLANIVTVYAMFALGPGDAMMILLCRVFLGSVFSGQMMTLFYSLAGGVLSWLVMLLLRRVLTLRQMWLCSPIAGIFHNLGQLLAAVVLMGTWTVLAYLPYLIIAGAISGVFTGLCAQFLLARLKKLYKKTAERRSFFRYQGVSSWNRGGALAPSSSWRA